MDEGGHFSPADIVGAYTLSLLLSSQTAHDRAVGNPIVYNRTHTATDRGHSTSLDREVLTSSPCE